MLQCTSVKGIVGSNLIVYQTKLKRHEDAICTAKQLVALQKESSGKASYSIYNSIVYNLICLGKYDEAAQVLDEWWQGKSSEVLSELVVKNGSLRESYWDEHKIHFEQAIPRYTLQIKSTGDPGMLYDNALLCKGLLLNTEREIDRQVETHATPEQKHLYTQLRQSQLLLVGELQKPRETRTVDTDSLQLAVRTLEHKLLSALQNDHSAAIVNALRPSWRDVQRQMKRNEVAVEFIDVRMGKDSTLIVALTLRPGYDRPHITRVCTLKELMAVPIADYYVTNRLYDLLWKPLYGELKNAGTVYFSPTGMLHQIGMEYLPGIGKRSMYRLSSTRELLKRSERKGRNIQLREAVLYGGLQYELNDDERQQIDATVGNATTVFRDIADLQAIRTQRGAAGYIPFLEGSLQEVTDIDSLMRRRHMEVATATGILGTEESFKALSGQSNNIIHISTHGFYQSLGTGDDSTDAMDILGSGTVTHEDLAMSRSGLLLTGAANYIYGMPNGLHDDGILTAREISRLDLSNCDLVVLSACETALGDISGEGVFGLQRGFKKAGAKTLLVSLWKVDDRATQLLMTEFYRLLLTGKSKRDAFLEAQHELRKAENGRFDNPECWAAFIMIDSI